MALGDSTDLQHRADSPVLIKVETEQCETYIEVDRNSDIGGNSSENASHNSESSGLAITTGNVSGDVGHTSSNWTVSSSQVAQASMVTACQPVRPELPPQQTQVIPTQMLVVPTTSFSRHYPPQSTHYPPQSTHYPLPRYATNHDIRTPFSTEMSLRPKVDSVQNMAEQLLSNSVQFAKNIPNFKSLPFRDQIILLEESWKDFFILDAAFWSFPLDLSCLVSPSDANTSILSHLRLLQELMTRIQALELDETECGHLKTVVLFKPGTIQLASDIINDRTSCSHQQLIRPKIYFFFPDIKGLKDSEQIEKRQDDALIKLSDYIRTTRLESPARFGRLLLTLASFEGISQEMIEKLFFRAQSDSVEYILHDIFKKT